MSFSKRRYSIRRQFIKFYITCENGSSILKSLSFDKKKNFIFSSGTLNYIWQTWCRFWRTFWLAHILGGENLKRNYIRPYLTNKSEDEAIYFILYLLGKRPAASGRISGSYQEPTWGDIKVIEKIAIEIANLNISNVGTHVLSCFSALGDTPRHFQIVRNASIHLDKDGYENVRRILPYYVISDFDYPTEILFCKELITGKLAYQNWADDLITVIELASN